MRSSAAGSSRSARARSLPHGLWLAVAVAAALALGGCLSASGEGVVEGQVWAPSCGLDGAPFSLRPDFFALEPAIDSARIRIQRGSRYPDVSDGLSVFVADAEEFRKASLGEPVSFDAPEPKPVQMTLYLRRKCPVHHRPVAYVAVSGTITFESLYWRTDGADAVEASLPQTGGPAPASDRVTAATFDDVVLVDPAEPDKRHAVLHGYFRFAFDRGRPAQQFP